MGGHGEASALKVEVELTPAEHAALGAVAAKLGMSAPTLARALVVLCVQRLAGGDAELQRAVTGSRDAGCR